MLLDAEERKVDRASAVPQPQQGSPLPLFCVLASTQVTEEAVAVKEKPREDEDDAEGQDLGKTRQTSREESELRLFAKALWRMAQSRTSEAKTAEEEDTFASLQCAAEPDVSLESFLRHVVQQLNRHDIGGGDANHSIGFKLLGSALVLVDRLLTLTQATAGEPFRLSCRNVHRLMLTTMMIASKFQEDSPLNNRFWAKVGGVALAALNACELAVCMSLQFGLRVSSVDFLRVVRPH